MVRHLRFVVALSLAGALLAAPALADIPPADACQAADVGKACENASADGKMDLDGTCQKSKCSRATPSGTMSYECYLCKVGSAKDDGGCSTSRSGKNAALGLIPLLALGLLWSRRRKVGAS